MAPRLGLLGVFVLVLAANVARANFNITFPVVGVRALSATNTLPCRQIAASLPRLLLTAGSSSNFSVYILAASGVTGTLSPRFALADDINEPSPVQGDTPVLGVGSLSVFIDLPISLPGGLAYLEFMYRSDALSTDPFYQCIDLTLVPVAPPPPPTVAARRKSDEIVLGLTTVPFSLTAAAIGLVLICLALLLIWCCCCRRRRKQPAKAVAGQDVELAAPPIVLADAPTGAAAAAPAAARKRTRQKRRKAGPQSSGSKRLHHHHNSNVERHPFVDVDGRVREKIVVIEESSSAWIDGSTSELGDRYGESDESGYSGDESSSSQ